MSCHHLDAGLLAANIGLSYECANRLFTKTLVGRVHLFVWLTEVYFTRGERKRIVTLLLFLSPGVCIHAAWVTVLFCFRLDTHVRSAGVLACTLHVSEAARLFHRFVPINKTW